MLANLPDETTQLLIDICTMGTTAQPRVLGSDADANTSAKGSGFAAPSYLSYLAINRGAAAPVPAPAVVTTSSTETAQPPTPSTAKPVSEASGSTPIQGAADLKRTRTISTNDQTTPRSGSPVAGIAAANARPKAEKRPSPRLYFAHFVDNLNKFVVFLESVALKLWGQSVDNESKENDGSEQSLPLPFDEETDKQDQVAVWNTLLELYLTLSKNDNDLLRQKALRLLQSKFIPYDSMHALILCSTRDFTPGLILIWEKLDMYEDILRFYIDRENAERDASSPAGAVDASKKVLHYLGVYGPAHKHLYPLVLRFLTSSPDLLMRHAKELGEVLDVIERDKVMPPLAVVQVLSRNGVTSVGLVKEWLLKRIGEAKEEVQTVSAYVCFLSRFAH